MLSQSLSVQNLIRCVQFRDCVRFNADRGNLKLIAQRTAEKIESNSFSFAPMIVRTRAGHDCLQVSTLQDTLVVRKIADNIKRLYKIRQPDRSQIVRQVRALLNDGIPMSVLKIDLKDFYESVELDGILLRIADDHLLAPESRILLEKLLDVTRQHTQGLPRGLCVSAVLAELCMRDFDSTIRRLDGVYYYARYVDDMVVFCYLNPDLLLQSIFGLLPPGLTPNHTKSGVAIEVKASSDTKANAVTQSFDYLGYEFSRKDIDSERDVSVRIAGTKIRKIKTRIVKAFLDYMNNQDFELLEMRIKFLTGNYYVGWFSERSGLRAGIHYSYPLINDLGVLDDLTRFLGANAFAKSKSYGKRLSKALAFPQRVQLAKYSFRYGYMARVMHEFTDSDIHRIMRCWIHA